MRVTTSARTFSVHTAELTKGLVKTELAGRLTSVHAETRSHWRTERGPVDREPGFVTGKRRIPGPAGAEACLRSEKATGLSEEDPGPDFYGELGPVVTLLSSQHPAASRTGYGDSAKAHDIAGGIAAAGNDAGGSPGSHAGLKGGTAHLHAQAVRYSKTGDVNVRYDEWLARFARSRRFNNDNPYSCSAGIEAQRNRQTTQFSKSSRPMVNEWSPWRASAAGVRA